jgi:hypothetical protein
VISVVDIHSFQTKQSRRVQSARLKLQRAPNPFIVKILPVTD